MAKKRVDLSKISTKAPHSWDKDEYKAKTAALITELDELQNLLFASSEYSLLVVVQGMDASGKDGLIKGVFGKLNPQGVKVKSFKSPSTLELSHDFLWRVHLEVPAKGEIKVFNRSHYEDILITRVHNWIDDQTANERIRSINDFEVLLTQNKTVILKFYLHISHEEQQERLMERLTIPRKMWKYNKQDLEESKRWDTYMKYYEEVLSQCNDCPWEVIPSDQNWVKNYMIAQKVVDTLKSLKLKYPGLKPEDKKLAKSLMEENKIAAKK